MAGTNAPEPELPDFPDFPPFPAMDPDDLRQKLATAQNTLDELHTAAQNSERMVRYFDNLTFRTLSRHYVLQRQFPPSYFRVAADAAGIPRDIYRKWNPARWPYQTIKSPEQLHHISQLLLYIYLRLSTYPPTETFWDAHDRMANTVHHFHEEGATYNQIANYCLMQHTAFTDLLTKNVQNCKQPKHDPWILFERLRATTPHAVISAASVPRKSLHTLQGIQSRDYHQEIAARKQTIAELKTRIVNEGDDCTKCGAPWHNFRFESRHEEFSTLREHSCITCGHTIFTGQIVPVMINRYSPCEHCGAPRNNLSRHSESNRGAIIMLCKICNEYSIRPIGTST